MIKIEFWIYLLVLFIVSVSVYFIINSRQGKNPLFNNFTASNIWKAFVLNSIAASVIIFIALTVKQTFDTYGVDTSQTDVPTTNVGSVILTLGSTFVSSLLAYTIMYTFFGFGGGMLATTN